jgi:hypothetical protein
MFRATLQTKNLLNRHSSLSSNVWG